MSIIIDKQRGGYHEMPVRKDNQPPDGGGLPRVQVQGGCEGCHQYGRCIERDRHGRCSEYRSIESIREEVSAFMRSVKAACAAAPADKTGAGEAP